MSVSTSVVPLVYDGRMPPTGVSAGNTVEGTSVKANAQCTRGSLRENNELVVMRGDGQCWCTSVRAELGRAFRRRRDRPRIGPIYDLVPAGQAQGRYNKCWQRYALLMTAPSS